MTAANKQARSSEKFTVSTPIQDVIRYSGFGNYGRLIFPVNTNYYSGSTLGNLSLTPIFAPVSEITELLRARTRTDYTALIRQIREARDGLARICEE